MLRIPTVPTITTAIFVLLSAAGAAAQGLGFDSVAPRSEDPSSSRQRVVAAPKGENERFEFTTAEIRSLERAVFDAINGIRIKNGLAAVAWSEDAARIARLHSTNMATLKFFGHRGADGKMVDERADQLGVKKWSAIGENIAFNRGYGDPAAVAVEKWLLSAGHRDNLLNVRWKEAGVGVAVTSEGSFYFTQVFLERF